MPRFNFAQTAQPAQQTVATPVENKTEQTPAPVVTAQQAPVPSASPEGQTPQPAPVQTTAQTPAESASAKAVRKIKEAIAVKKIQPTRYKDEDGHDVAKFVAHPDSPEGLKEFGYWLTKLGAKWNIPKDGEQGVSTAILPSVVFTNPEAAEQAYQARKSVVDERRAKREERNANKPVQVPSASPEGKAIQTAKQNGERVFTEAQVRELLKKSNSTLTAELIDILIKTA